MKTITCFSFILLILYSSPLFSQITPENITPCYSDQHQNALRVKYPEMESIDEFERWIAPKLKQHSNNTLTSEVCNGPINVIFHIIHGGDPVGTGDNISSDLINGQIAQLNADFAAVGISFAAAQFNENNVPLAEPGINRINRQEEGWLDPPYGIICSERPDEGGPTFPPCQTPPTYVDEIIQPQSQWDPNRYLNIWVMELFCNIAGYAQFPNSSNLPGLETEMGIAQTDGVTIIPQAIGNLNIENPEIPYIGYGRVLVHELGHFFGLFHPWGSCCSITCCDVDDFCNDTPRSSKANLGCEVTAPFCLDENGQQITPDFKNFMDFTSDQCRDHFSPNQIARMAVVLNNSPRRGSLCCESTLEIDFHMEDQNGLEKNVFCYGESIFFDGSSNTYVSDYYVEVKKRALLSNDNWVYLVGIELIDDPYFNFSDWLIAHGHTVSPGEYAIKFAARNECDAWVEANHTFQVHSNLVTSEFYFENEDQIIQESFCSFETVFLNGSASTGETRYWLEVGRAPIGTQNFTGLTSDWAEGQVNTINFNQWMANQGFPLEEGFIYQTKLGVQNACDPWDETTHSFIYDNCCVPPTNLTCMNENGNTFLTWTSNDLDATGFLLFIYPTTVCCENPGTTSPEGIFVSTNQFPVADIRQECFEWRVLTICGDAGNSQLSDPACYTPSSLCWGFSPTTENDKVGKKVAAKPTISPNPNNGKMMIELKVDEPTSIDIQIFNLKGQLIHKFETEEANTGIFQKEWNANSNVSTGIYFVHIRTNKASFQEKIVITK